MFERGLICQPYGGIKIHIKPTMQETHVLKRSWKERLFTKPWTPLVKTKIWIDEKAVEDNKTAYRIGNDVYVTAAMHDQIKKEMA